MLVSDGCCCRCCYFSITPKCLHFSFLLLSHCPPFSVLYALFNLTFPSSIFLFCYLRFMLALLATLAYTIFFLSLIVVRMFLFLCTAKNFSIDIALKEVSKVTHVYSVYNIHTRVYS